MWQESLKELARVMVLAVLPVVIDSLQQGKVDFRLIWATGAIAGLKFVDSMLHEWGKEKSTKKTEHWATTGLTRF